MQDDTIIVDVGSSLVSRSVPAPSGENQESAKKVVITSMDAVSDCLDRNSLVIGLSTGQGMVYHVVQFDGLLFHSIAFMHAVIVMAPPTGSAESLKACPYNSDRSLNSSRCVLVSWVPSSHGSEFISVHENGQILRHHRITGNSSDKELLSRTENQAPSSELAVLSHGRVTTASLSPDGAHLAVGTTDHGMLYIVDIGTGHVTGGFSSFFGNFCCCSWSPDGKYIAAGGEDDLIALYKLGSTHVFAHCQGHTSWPTCCTFEYCSDTRLRLLSVGQDCRLCIWEMVLEPEADSPSQKQIFVPTVKSAEMNRVTPVFSDKIHTDPLSFVQIVFDKYLTVCAYDGTFKSYVKQ